MANINLHNLARMTVSSTGTGTITLNAAVSGFLTFDLAGCSTAAAGTIVQYAIADTTKSELAFGTYTSSSLTLTRGSSTTGMKSTNSNSPIDMSNSAQVFITDAAISHPIVPDSAGAAGTLSLNMTYSGTAVFSAGTTFSAAITYGGVTLNNAVTGTGNMVLSASPTFTGTTTIATLALTTVGAHTISGAITYGGVTLTNAVTGTGSMVLSASPTITGTASIANIVATSVGATAVSADGATVVNVLSGGSVAGTMVATQADMETGTSTSTLVSPGRVVFHPGVAKAWVSFNSAGTISSQFNVTSITVNGTGDFSVNFTTAMSGTSYVAVTTVDDDNRGMIAQPSVKATTSVRLAVVDAGGNVADPSGEVYVVVFGDR